ncbi:hypothetical protein [Lactococcus petauri]|uniref:hypothetical protein n=1 Tax=Lactococcus petauri TaxID=1940789 RepID=UPI0018A98A0E|nr:hypothetical protein [Lactococcus petauri]MDC0826973.1 hypothetical protein [Lactococcus petauri]
MACKMGYEPLYIFPYYDETESEEYLRARMDGIMAGISPGDLVLHLSPIMNSFRYSKKFVEPVKQGEHTIR